MYLLLRRIRPNVDPKFGWVTTDWMKQKLPDEFAKFVVEDLARWTKRMKPIEPEHYKASWTQADYYDKPCDWMIQDHEYNQSMFRYRRQMQSYDDICETFFAFYEWAEAFYKSTSHRSETRQHNNFRQMDTVKMYSTRKSNDKYSDPYEYAYIDSGSDTFGIGGNAWIIDHITNRTVQIAGYHTTDTIKNDVPIGTGITAVDLPNGTTVLIRANEATILDKDANTLFSVPQMLENNVEVQDKAKRHGGLSYLGCEGTVLPLIMVDAMMCLKIRKPTEAEIDTCEVIDITSPEPWHPYDVSDDTHPISSKQYEELVHSYEERQLNLKKHKDEPIKIEKNSPYFLYPGETVMKKTLQNTTRYGSLNMRIPMRQNYKSRNPLLQRRRFLEGAATDM